ncbi:MAG: PSD1 and planctomycete cytochrome C domain-containing protein [Aureliella sp.]
MFRLCLLLIVAWLPCNLFAADLRFNDDIRPILAEYCLECHGPDASQRQADLRLDVGDWIDAASTSSDQSLRDELLKRLTTQDADLRMPPHESGKQLSAAQIEAMRRWIEAGAPYEGHWAYQPVRRPQVPQAGAEALTEIDHFLLARLRAKGLTYSSEISRQAWIRRATFDLIGIPPTWSEVEAFANDTSPTAYEKVIDRLLESPRYGERWGRHWLDLARYADTHGGSAIGFTQFPFSYTYRDYVIRAFNADLPYDRFVTEQLAADQLGLQEHDPALAALGFLTVGMQFRNRHDTLDDQIDVITRGLQGLTVACARCHDHKFDAISTEDYYSLYAALAPSHPPDELPVVGQAPEGKAYEDYQSQLGASQTEYTDMAREQSEVMRSRLRMQVGLYLRELAKGVPEQDTSTSFLSYRTDDLRPIILNRWRDYLVKMPDTDAVFGPWVRLSRLPQDDFQAQAAALCEQLTKENGKATAPAEFKTLGRAAPKWNPRVLESLTAGHPQSMLAVAEIYGELFANLHRDWLAALERASAEAMSGGTIVPDEDEQHLEINSAVLRQLRRHIYGADTPTAIPDAVASKLLNRTVSDTLGGKRGAIHNLHLSSPGSPPRAMILDEDPSPPTFHVLRRGNPLDRGPAVQARYLTAVSGDGAEPFVDGKRRLGLAQAIVDRENPLTRRVIANWVWQHHFGQGMVRTPDDFGTRGRPPTHPQLLDYLAEEFLADGWSIKKLHRRIMLSRAYRQAALENPAARTIDPENELLWRMPRRRIDLEAMRDSLLAVSEELDTTMGGRPIDLLATPAVPRRSVYGFINRDIVSNFASTFDGPNPNSCTAQRPDTTVPQQTLFALNSEFIQDRAARLAKLAENACPGAEQRVRWMYRRLFAREPDAEELEMSLRYVGAEQGDAERTGSGATDGQTARWQQLAHVLLAANEFVFVD